MIRQPVYLSLKNLVGLPGEGIPLTYQKGGEWVVYLDGAEVLYALRADRKRGRVIAIEDIPGPNGTTRVALKEKHGRVEFRLRGSQVIHWDLVSLEQKSGKAIEERSLAVGMEVALLFAPGH